MSVILNNKKSVRTILKNNNFLLIKNFKDFNLSKIYKMNIYLTKKILKRRILK